MGILSSASKIVFILMAVAVAGAFVFEVVVGRVTLDPKDFMMLAAMAFSFYFANKGDSATGVTTATTTGTTVTPPFLGK